MTLLKVKEQDQDTLTTEQLRLRSIIFSIKKAKANKKFEPLYSE